MTAHICQDCGLLHDMPAAQEESDEVKIARINREADVKIEQMRARQERQELETVEAVAEIQADAQVEAAVVEGEVVAAALAASDVEAEPIEIVAPDVVQDLDVDMDVENEPPPAGGSPLPDEPKSRGLGMW